MRTPAQCGTNGGYYAHKRRKERACLPCLDAVNDRTRHYSILAGRSTVMKLPVRVVSLLLASAPEGVREELVTQLGPLTVKALTSLHVAEEVAGA